MAKFRVTTYYTGSIDTDVIADNAVNAIEQVRSDETPFTQDTLREALDDIEESWIQRRKAWEIK